MSLFNFYFKTKYYFHKIILLKISNFKIKNYFWNKNIFDKLYNKTISNIVNTY